MGWSHLRNVAARSAMATLERAAGGGAASLGRKHAGRADSHDPIFGSARPLAPGGLDRPGQPCRADSLRTASRPLHSACRIYAGRRAARLDFDSLARCRATRYRGAGMKFVVFGLTITSTWGNGHATLWRGLSKALAR